MSLDQRYDSNAYGSITWTILGVHLTHLLAGTIETFLIGLVMYFVFRKLQAGKADAGPQPM